MKKIKFMGLLTIIISLLLGISAVPAMAATYTSMDDMSTAIINGTAVKYTDIVNFGTYNSKTLKWIYMGPNQDTSDTITKTEPYFVMTKNSFQTMNLSKVYDSSGDNKSWTSSELYAWLNGAFKSTNLNNDSNIFEVTLLSYQDYSDRIKSISGEGEYNNEWWLRGASFGRTNTALCVNQYGDIARNYGAISSLGVRPVFYLKANSLPNNPITFNGSTDLSDISISGSTVVNIVCAQTEGGLTNQRYQWSLDSAKPSTGWTSFTGNKVTATQAVAATWYLHVSCKDAFGHETYVKKKYTITAAGSGGVTQADIDKIRDEVAAHSTIVNTNNNTISNGQSSAYWANSASTYANTAVTNTTYNSQSAAYWAYQASQNASASSTYMVIVNKPYKIVINGEYGDAAPGAKCDATDVESGGTGAEAALAVTKAGSGVTVVKNNPDYKDAEGNPIIGFASEGIKSVTIGTGTNTKTIYFNVIAVPTSTGVTVTWPKK